MGTLGSHIRLDVIVHIDSDPEIECLRKDESGPLESVMVFGNGPESMRDLNRSELEVSNGEEISQLTPGSSSCSEDPAINPWN